MAANHFGHLEHVDLALAAENRLEDRVGPDHGTFVGILKIVFLDVVPELLGHLSSGEGFLAYDFRQRAIRLNRSHERGVGCSFL